MDLIKVPHSSLAISRLAFGCARLGGGPDFRTSARLIESALKNGISHFDTAPMYGSEEVLGAVLGNLPGITVATKVGIARAQPQRGGRRHLRALYRSMVRPILGNVPYLKAGLRQALARSKPAAAAPARRVLSRDEIHRELEESLKLLRRTHIDLYMLHEPERIELTDELLEVFRGLQRSGVVGAFGMAYGGPLPLAPASFGTVDQCQYTRGLDGLDASRDGERLLVLHGVLRRGLHEPGSEGRRPDAGQLVAQVMRLHPGASILFSASTERQIRQICAAA